MDKEKNVCENGCLHCVYYNGEDEPCEYYATKDPDDLDDVIDAWVKAAKEGNGE